MSIVALDPGTTTGIAVWDAWSKRLFVDQIDSGRGKKVRYKVHGGFIESKERKDAEAVVSSGKGQNKVSGSGNLKEMQILDIVERGVVTVIADCIRAAGPIGVVICEDFILGWGNPNNVRSAKRDGLSPVRITSRLVQHLEDFGFYNGDAWRDYDGFGAHAADGRGVKIIRGMENDYKRRLTDCEMWRLGEGRWSGKRLESVLWAGSGVSFIRRLPGERLWLGARDGRKSEQVVADSIRERGQWLAGYPHGMDAVMHMLAWGRSVGIDIRQNPEPIWGRQARVGNRVSNKAAQT